MTEVTREARRQVIENLIEKTEGTIEMFRATDPVPAQALGRLEFAKNWLSAELLYLEDDNDEGGTMAHGVDEPQGPETLTWVDVSLNTDLSGDAAMEAAGWFNERLREAYQQGREDGWEAAHNAEGDWA